MLDINKIENPTKQLAVEIQDEKKGETQDGPNNVKRQKIKLNDVLIKTPDQVAFDPTPQQDEHNQSQLIWLHFVNKEVTFYNRLLDTI